MSAITHAVYGTLFFLLGYLWRWWRDRKIAKEMQEHIRVLRDRL